VLRPALTGGQRADRDWMADGSSGFGAGGARVSGAANPARAYRARDAGSCWAALRKQIAAVLLLVTLAPLLMVNGDGLPNALCRGYFTRKFE
jgi:hypothetical protein